MKSKEILPEDKRTFDTSWDIEAIDKIVLFSKALKIAAYGNSTLD